VAGVRVWQITSNASPEEQRERARSSIPARRFGTPEEFGAATGQNVLFDGGQYRGLL